MPGFQGDTAALRANCIVAWALTRFSRRVIKRWGRTEGAYFADIAKQGKKTAERIRGNVV